MLIFIGARLVFLGPVKMPKHPLFLLLIKLFILTYILHIFIHIILWILSRMSSSS
jgi:hypothetical protein